MPTWILKLSRRSRPSMGSPAGRPLRGLMRGSRCAGVLTIRPLIIQDAPRLTSGVGPLAGDEVVGQGDSLFGAAGRSQVQAVLAVDHKHRHAGNLVGHGQLLGL